MNIYYQIVVVICSGLIACYFKNPSIVAAHLYLVLNLIFILIAITTKIFDGSILDDLYIVYGLSGKSINLTDLTMLSSYTLFFVLFYSLINLISALLTIYCKNSLLRKFLSYKANKAVILLSRIKNVRYIILCFLGFLICLQMIGYMSSPYSFSYTEYLESNSSTFYQFGSEFLVPLSNMMPIIWLLYFLINFSFQEKNNLLIISYWGLFTWTYIYFNAVNSRWSAIIIIFELLKPTFNLLYASKRLNSTRYNLISIVRSILFIVLLSATFQKIILGRSSLQGIETMTSTLQYLTLDVAELFSQFVGLLATIFSNYILVYSAILKNTHNDSATFSLSISPLPTFFLNIDSDFFLERVERVTKFAPLPGTVDLYYSSLIQWVSLAIIFSVFILVANLSSTNSCPRNAQARSYGLFSNVTNPLVYFSTHTLLFVVLALMMQYPLRTAMRVFWLACSIIMLILFS